MKKLNLLLLSITAFAIPGTFGQFNPNVTEQSFMPMSNGYRPEHYLPVIDTIQFFKNLDPDKEEKEGYKNSRDCWGLTAIPLSISTILTACAVSASVAYIPVAAPVCLGVVCLGTIYASAHNDFQYTALRTGNDDLTFCDWVNDISRRSSGQSSLCEIFCSLFITTDSNNTLSGEHGPQC